MYGCTRVWIKIGCFSSSTIVMHAITLHKYTHTHALSLTNFAYVALSLCLVCMFGSVALTGFIRHRSVVGVRQVRQVHQTVRIAAAAEAAATSR